VVLEAAAQGLQAILLLLLELPIRAAVAVAAGMLQQALTVAQAAQASSSLNTTHHYNPFSHSKAQPSG
jgi:hypothetical protein